MQRCIKCQELKPLPEFYFRNDTGKHRGTCKVCWDEKSRQYYRKNRSAIVRQRAKQRLTRDPVGLRQQQRRYEYKKRGIEATLQAREWLLILALFEDRCAYCDLDYERLQQEHFIPIAKGGGYTIDNIVPACPNCNTSKGVQHPRDWLDDEQRYEFILTTIGDAQYALNGGI